MSVPTEPEHQPLTATRAAAPALVVVATELKPGDPGIWQPNSYHEWESRERLRTFLATWSEQMQHEQTLRTMGARVIFWLIGLQVAGVFAIVVVQGLGYLRLDVDVLKVLLPSVLAEVFGLGYVVTKYLFSQSLRHGLDTLVQGARPRHSGPGGEKDGD